MNKYNTEDYFSVINKNTGRKIVDCGDENDALLITIISSAVNNIFFMTFISFSLDIIISYIITSFVNAEIKRKSLPGTSYSAPLHRALMQNNAFVP